MPRKTQLPRGFDPDLTASALAVKALGLAPLGVPWTSDEPLMCALEARPIRRGDPVMPWRPGPNFLDQQDTIASPVISGHAAALMTKPVMLKTQRAVFCREGAFPLATDAARAWFFLTPPEPPYVAVIANSMLQHLIWRTPICWSRDDIVFRHGPNLLRIRRPRLIEAMELLRAHDGAVFRRLDREGKDPDHGIFRNDVPEELRANLADLLPGELLALATLAKRIPPTPEQPEPIILTKPAKRAA